LPPSKASDWEEDVSANAKSSLLSADKPPAMLFGGWDGPMPRKFQAPLQSNANALHWKMVDGSRLKQRP